MSDVKEEDAKPEPIKSPYPLPHDMVMKAINDTKGKRTIFVLDSTFYFIG
jgi:hypothetical protein